MATRDSLLSYYTGNFARFDQLQNRFGDYLERLSAIDKLDLIVMIAAWQSYDTLVRGNGGDPIGLWEYLDDAQLPLQPNPESDLPLALPMLRGCTEGEALTLLQCLASQLREGCYS